jgi:stress-induced morphogen
MTNLEHLRTKLSEAFAPAHLLVENESGSHNVPKGSQSHFKVVIVSEKFANLSLMERHRLIYELFKDELKTKIHALSLNTHTPAEWQKCGQAVPESPPCLGGSKHES